jgi:4-hydroxy-tetrahydrodipicolinate reductase
MSPEDKRLRVALFGAAGRMGRTILHEAREHKDLLIVKGYDPAGAGQYFGEMMIEPSCHGVRDHIHVAIDFSTASAVQENATCAMRAKIPYVCGVTALPEKTLELFREASKEIPLLHAPNMSPAMNVLFAIAPQIAAALPDYNMHIVETHHTKKLDSPSGTALRIAEILEDTSGKKPEISALRMGDVIGEHRIVFGGPGERIELVHRADARAVFAHGALRAAAWLAHQPAGHYAMTDMLGL